MIDNLIIDRILETAKIEEVIGDFIDLKKKGIRYLGICPFHDDHDLGNFVVYPKGSCYKCFKCGEKGGVIDFLMKHARLSYPDAIRWLGKKYSIDTDTKDFKYTPPPPKPKAPPLKELNLPMSMAKQKMDVTGDNLVQWIRTGINWDTVQRHRVEEVLRDYMVGHSRQGHTIFWQIDDEQHVRTGKMMKYKTDGHRDKVSSWNFDYIHSMLSRKKNESDPWPYPQFFNPDTHEARLTYFGMHLIDRFSKTATINIVESEKTALLMAIAYGNHASQVWMACGGLEMLSRERMAPIINRQRRIVLYPDRDGVEKWEAKARQIDYQNLTVNAKPVTQWWREGDGEKADIADVVIRIINESKPITNMAQVAERMPEAMPLINKLNLTIANDGERKV